ncbi:EAL domain-containing protein [Sulfurimonas sp.]|uniref:EAL domain-containing protein n=1 Tax=Sulfurimonas sp. TaxID=2022749 RepID=UPI00356664CF
MYKLGEVKKDKKIDTIFLLVIFFLFFIIALFSYLLKVNDIIYERNQYDSAIAKLPVYDESFNNFFLKSTSFNNYDVVNRNIFNFEEIIKLLNSNDIKEKYGNRYLELLEKLETNFNEKRDAIERFKSQNALLISSIHYQISLNKAITDKKLLKGNKDIQLLNKTMTDLLAYYINPSIDYEHIEKNIQYFSKLYEKNKLRELKLFIQHALVNTQRIQELFTIKKTNFQLNKSIYDLKEFLTTKFENALYNSRIVVTILFIIAFLILSIVVFLYKRSLRIKDDLISFKTAVENSYNSIVITDSHSNIIYVNDMAVKETGYSRDELIGQNPRILKSGDKSESFYRKMHEHLDAGRKWEGEFVNRRKDGSQYYEKASIMPIVERGRITNYLAIKLNITDYIMQQRKVEYMAYHDSLTGLPNRTNIEEYLEYQLPIAEENNLGIAVLFIDIDNFKTINDSLGHDVGDSVIIECSKILKNTVKESEIVARIGGDEFVIIISGENTKHTSTNLCSEILKSFAKPIEANGYKLSITLSIGVSLFPEDSNDHKKLFKHADIAMYEAKDKGKNNFQFYKKKLSSQMHDRLEIEQALKQALKEDEIYVVYQPKYDIATKQIVGLEALARWNSKELGNIRPDKFISIAEETGDILEIGHFIFKKACEDFRTFKTIYPELESISINVSTIQLYNKKFVEEILNITKETKVYTSSVMIEITETHVMKNITYSMGVLNTLKEFGFRVSIDDFGTGHSSLNYLKRFPIDELKIDKSFVDDLPLDSNDIAIAKAIISLSRNMGYKNVAEGIETIEQEEFLLSHGCDVGQGYLFCKPKEKEDLLEFLQDQLS